MIIIHIICHIFTSNVASSLSDWNFSGLESDTYYQTANEFYSYRFNFRKTLPTDSLHKCDCTDCVLEEVSSGTYCWCYGNISTEVIEIYPDDTGINFTYVSNGTTGVPTDCVFMLKCADTFNYSAIINGYSVVAKFEGKQGCKLKVKKKDLFGIVFLLILVGVVVLYFVIGIIVQVIVFKKLGIEMFPLTPIVFFFKLVKDGFLFLMYLVKPNSSTYDALK